MKIGKSNDPIKRLKSLQTGCPSKITMVGAIKCKSENHAFRVESAFHKYFSEKRKDGEWFHCTDFILTKVWDVLNQLEGEDSAVHSLSARELEELHAR